MGMLASFESFGQTARKKKRGASGEDGNFEGSDQAETDAEKEGADVGVIEGLRKSYFKHVAPRPMPHPKMDCVVDSLRAVFEDGQKALVFVRRIASVRELGDKLRDHYDAWIEETLCCELPDMRAELGKVFDDYRTWRRSRMGISRVEGEVVPVEEDDGAAPRIATDESGDVDDPDDDVTFFSWFFRGEGPEKRFSGASFRNNQLQGDSSPFGTFFEENYVILLLGAAADEDPLGALSRATEQDRASLSERLRQLAAAKVQGRRGEIPRRAIFEAYQAAALVVLAGARRSFKRWADAEALLDLRFPGTKRESDRMGRSSFPDPDEYLKIQTFFSEVQRRPALAQVFFPRAPDGPAKFALDRELRRELLSHTARLGHAFITLWALAAEMLGSLEARRAERGHDIVSRLLKKYCDRLASEIGRGGLTAMYELSSVSQNFDEIVRLNFPEAKRAKDTASIRKELRKELSAQRPVAGMFGGVTPRIVKQFRMPGYPLVLVSTDVVKEGEDLHTFCSKVIHYGIAWNPSEMEQRTGRIDRIGSATHRRLGALERPVRADEKLEAQYPYLGETVERLQMARLFRKMNRFVRTMHLSFGGEELGSRGRESAVHVDQAFAGDERDTAPIEGLLETKFEIDEKLLLRGAQKIEPRERQERAEACVDRLSALLESLGKRIRIDWHDEKREARVGTTYRQGPRLLGPRDGAVPGENGVRLQPFLLYVEGAPIEGRALVHLTSPVGKISEDTALAELLQHQEESLGARICLVTEKEGLQSYTVTVEGDILLDPATTEVEELCDLFAAVALCADDVEQMLLPDADREYRTFEEDLKKERATVRDG
ncbi:helicase-related protein [Polyangium sp. y55x31]|uniref:helicase-related protein n=1 Tax=Polyangium sp. y55x31 TaxID=3042688 RepID=UPI002482C917|nr:helicase-related protein [Polyangium sp. y55x31]MDI1478728.1 helicase-related protein [Polyangium sp. y55x31]